MFQFIVLHIVLLHRWPVPACMLKHLLNSFTLCSLAQVVVIIVVQAEMGSTNVRVGSTIFGARVYAAK